MLWYKNKNMNKNYWIKLTIWLAVFAAIGAGISWYINTHDFKWQSPVVFRKPLAISKKVYSVVTIVNAEVKDPNVSPLTPDQQYLCNVFGKDCKTAIAIQRAENGSGICDTEAFNYDPKTNKVSSVDYGFMMINSVHLKKGWTRADLMDCRKNVDHAFEIFKQQGWNPWVAYQNGSYKKFLIN